MDRDNKITFSEVLDTLFTSETVPIAPLYRLSDLNEAQLVEFKQRWDKVPEERRGIIARHLVDISEENFVVDFSAVFHICFTDESAAVRVAGLDGIWDETNPRLIDPVIDLVRTDPAIEVRAAAAAALSHYVLLAEWGQVHRPAASKIVEVLLAEYEKPQTAVVVKRAALEALGAANHPRVVDLIDTAYASDDPDVVLSAVFAMGSSADERWLPTVLKEMESDSVEMRIEAARAAGSIGDSGALPLLAHLAVDEDLEVAMAVVEALGQLGGDTAHKMLLQMAEDEHFARLHDAVTDTLEEMDWLGGEFDIIDVWEGEESDHDHALEANGSS